MTTVNPILNIFELISSNESITSQIGEWRGSPAITNIQPIPEDIEGRFIFLEEDTSEQTEYSGITLLKQTISVTVFTSNEQTTLEVKKIAIMIFDLIHYHSFNTEDGVVFSKAYYPVYVSDDQYNGYRVTCDISCSIDHNKG